MPDKPTERDIEAAAYLIHEAECTAYTHEGRNARCHRAARAVLTSEWYAERIAEARCEGAAELAVKLGLPTTASVPTPLAAGGDA